MFKKIACMFFIITMVFSAFACGGKTTITISKVENENGEVSTKTMKVGSLKQQLQNAVTVIDVNEEYERDKNDQFINKARYNFNKVSIVYFGSYPQSDSSGYTKDPIEWYVLEKDGLKALLISKFVLDKKDYNDEKIECTWETCSLRKWLNNDFYNYAFDNSEKKQIINTNVINKNETQVVKKYDGFKSTPFLEIELQGGKNTNDNVFLLSEEEFNKFYIDSRDDNNIGKCEGTQYSGYSYDYWWLRSPSRHAYRQDNKEISNVQGFTSTKRYAATFSVGPSYEYGDPYDTGGISASCINFDGGVSHLSVNNSPFDSGVRPVIWVSYK